LGWRIQETSANFMNSHQGYHTAFTLNLNFKGLLSIIDVSYGAFMKPFSFSLSFSSAI
jgi:hypothetical protein